MREKPENTLQNDLYLIDVIVMAALGNRESYRPALSCLLHRLALLTLCYSLPLSAEVTLVNHPATPDELIADQSTIVPCRLPVAFTSFRYPHINPDETVTFIADDVYYRGGKRFGIYRSDGRTGSLEKLVNNEDTPPGIAIPFHDFLGLQVEGLNYVFRARTRDGEVDGIYADFGDGLRSVADTLNQGIPVGAGFRSFAYADISEDWAIFIAQDKRGMTGLFGYDSKTRSLHRLVDKTSTISDGSTISRFNGAPWLDAKSIVFRAFDQDEKPGIYRIDRSRLNVNEPVNVEVLLNQKTPLPVPITIQEITSAPVDGNLIAFRVQGQNDTGEQYVGIFTLQNGVVSRIVDNYTEIPESGIILRDFNKWVAVSDGIVIFRAFGDNGFEGLFAYNTASSELHALIDNSASIEGQPIERFEIAAAPLIKSRVAFVAIFQNGNDGIYLASLPSPITSHQLPLH